MRARYRLIAFSAVALLGALPACGGGSSNTTAATVAPATSATTSAAPTTQATTTAPPTTQATTTTSSAASTTSAGTGDGELVAAGKVLFDTTAGGVGCAVCHGEDATGIEDLASPDIRGADFMTIANALVERAQMTTLVLSDDDIKAVVAYLATLDPDA